MAESQNRKKPADSKPVIVVIEWPNAVQPPTALPQEPKAPGAS